MEAAIQLLEHNTTQTHTPSRYYKHLEEIYSTLGLLHNNSNERQNIIEIHDDVQSLNE